MQRILCGLVFVGHVVVAFSLALLVNKISQISYTKTFKWKPSLLVHMCLFFRKYTRAELSQLNGLLLTPAQRSAITLLPPPPPLSKAIRACLGNVLASRYFFGPSCRMHDIARATFLGLRAMQHCTPSFAFGHWRGVAKLILANEILK